MTPNMFQASAATQHFRASMKMDEPRYQPHMTVGRRHIDVPRHNHLTMGGV